MRLSLGLLRSFVDATEFTWLYVQLAPKMRIWLQETADLVTFSEEILNGKLHFLCSAASAQVNGHLPQLSK